MENIAASLGRTNSRCNDNSKALNTDLLQTIVRAYNLQQPRLAEHIYTGTNQVYCLRFNEGSDPYQLAVKLTKFSGRETIDNKQFQTTVLNRLHAVLPYLPCALAPLSDAPQTIRHAWGLQYRNIFLVSVYKWQPHKNYRGLAPQLKQAGKSVKQLQQAMAGIDIRDLDYSSALTTQQRLQIKGTCLFLDKHFRLTPFRDFISEHANYAAPYKFLNKHLSFLETELEALHITLDAENPVLNSHQMALIHRELSPSNFGFNPDHSIAAIFDFDSLGMGHPLQDCAWMAATFCIDNRKQFAPVIHDLKTLLKAMIHHLDTYPGWQKIFLPLMRLGYLDAIFLKLHRARHGTDSRMGFVREDILSLKWLRDHNDQLQSAIVQL